jgi:group I intron endonuclease
MSEKGFIYKITNQINEKEYVGCTIYSLRKRFEEHAWRCLKSDSNTKFCNSIRKYGVKNFNIELIEECDISLIYEREKHYINEFKTYEYGLNSTIGGEGCLGYKHSKEIRMKISELIKNGRSHKGKTYKEIYGDRFNEEKVRRRESVKKSWVDLTEDDRKNRLKKTQEAKQKNSKYGVELVKEIKNKIKEGLTSKQFTELYPDIRKNFYYELKNGKRWANIN